MSRHLLSAALSVLLASSAAAQANDPYLPSAGEIRVQGTLRAIDPQGANLVLDAMSFVLPSGKGANYPAARAKIIPLGDRVLLHVRGDRERKLRPAELKVGLPALAVGKDGGTGTFTAREVAVWEQEAGGRFMFGGGAVGADPAPACKIALPRPGDPVAAKLSVTIEVSDDREVKHVQVTASEVEGTGTKPIIVGSKPLIVGSKPILIGAKGLPPGHTVVKVYGVDVNIPAGKGDIRLHAVVTDQAGQMARDEVLLPRAGRKPGNLWVLALGIGSYRIPQYGLPRAAGDAHAFAEALRTQKGRQYAGVSAVVLQDLKASAHAIRAALDDLRKAAPTDTVMVFVSGHAIWGDSQNGGERPLYLALSTIRINDLPATCLPWSELTSSLARSPGQKLLLCDVAHAGHQFGDRLAPSSAIAAQRGSGIAMLTGASGNEVGRDAPEAGHSAFTATLIEAFSGSSASHTSTLRLLDLLTLMQERVRARTGGAQTPWSPPLEDLDPRLPLARFDRLGGSAP